MTDKEKFEMYVAQCQICLLAECLKVCENCPFKVGLKSKENENV